MLLTTQCQTQVTQCTLFAAALSDMGCVYSLGIQPGTVV